MALLMDALNTQPRTSIIHVQQPTPPRYTARCVNKHSYQRVTRHLEFSVSWIGSDSEETVEIYSNLQHLHVLTEYEERLHSLTQGNHRNDIKRHSRVIRKYILQWDREAAARLTEEDTDYDISDLGEVLLLSLEGSPLCWTVVPVV
jgi:hypothetical protein